MVLALFGTRRGRLTSLALAMALVLVAGCGTRFKERHYFASVDPVTGVPSNYFRMQVSGFAAFSTARYVSGFYDERAVDLFFNEIKGEDEIAPIFEDDVELPGTDETLAPLGPDAEHGAFVMILSTNANAVADTIGAFAESREVAEAITHLVNRDAVREARRAKAEFEVAGRRASAVVAELDELVEKAAQAQTEEAWLRVLNALAAALGASEGFADLDEARLWFAARRAGSGAAP